MKVTDTDRHAYSSTKQTQGGLLALLIIGRLALVRWQLQTYHEYGGMLALYEELAMCARPDEIDSMKIIRLFQVCVYVCLTHNWCDYVERRVTFPHPLQHQTHQL